MSLMNGKSRIFFILFLLALLSAKQASAAQHVVGGSQGWDESVDLDSWASGRTFKVGDQLGMFLFPDHNYVRSISFERC